MGLIIYRCPDDFPARIPDILANMQTPATSEGGEEAKSEFKSSYQYNVKRGMGQILIYGCREDDFMSVTIVDGSLNPFRGSASLKLSKDATKALLEAGMEEISTEELQEYDTRQRQKEAEQDAAGNHH